MEKYRIVSITFLVALILLFIGREIQAVIYKYVNEKDIPTYADDMQKIPEQYRARSVIVSGGNDYDEYAEQEKARLAAEVLARQESQAAAPVRAEESLSGRLVRSGVAIGLFFALLFVATHIDALREQAQVLSRVRTALVVLLVAFLGFTHARDVRGLFGKVGDTVTNPVASIQEKSAARGRKAAAAYKSMDRIMDQQAQDEEARLREIERKFDEAERGK